MKTTISSLVLVLATFFSAPLGAQQFIDLPSGSWCTDVSPDGRIVAGIWNWSDAFIWKWQEEPAPTVFSGGQLVAISDDGTVAAGTIKDPVNLRDEAAVWTAATGWQSIGYLPNALGCPDLSTAYDISGDGSTIVGLSWEACNGVGFRWTAATGMQPLELLAQGNNRASAISGDGSVLAGFAQGTFDRTPAFWGADTSGDIVDIDLLGEVFGLSEDGSLSVGTFVFPGKLYSEAFVRDASTGSFTNVGSLKDNWTGQAIDVSEDGNTVVGFDVKGFGRNAWIWTPSSGIVSLNDHVIALGLSAVDPLQVCNAVSDDGNVIVGGGYDPDPSGIPFYTGGFILVQEDIPWTNLVGGTAGINGTPSLQGSGSLVGGTTATLELTDAPADALMLAWLSFAPTPVEAIGGTLHATPFSKQFLFAADAAGSFSASTSWPVGVPSGSEVWYQFIVQDASSIHGLTLSNGLKATTP